MIACGGVGYRGRFAPSPTGPLHQGSLVAALASYLDARAHSGTWLVRIEDVDELRTRAGAVDDILRSLEHFGMEWDEPVVYQSARREVYREIIEALLTDGAAYRCACSRSDLARTGRPGIDGPVYAGTCRQGIAKGKQGRTVRLRTEPGGMTVEDRILGTQQQDVGTQVGDFVIRRADGFTAYQLAVVVDDAEQRITDVVRGADLLVSTPRQRYLQQVLGYAPQHYAHVPLVLDPSGRKLSKSLGDAAIARKSPLQTLLDAFRFLGQKLPGPTPETLPEFWSRAIAAWRIEAVGKAHDPTDTL